MEGEELEKDVPETPVEGTQDFSLDNDFQPDISTEQPVSAQPATEGLESFVAAPAEVLGEGVIAAQGLPETENILNSEVEDSLASPVLTETVPLETTPVEASTEAEIPSVESAVNVEAALELDSQEATPSEVPTAPALPSVENDPNVEAVPVVETEYIQPQTEAIPQEVMPEDIPTMPEVSEVFPQQMDTTVPEPEPANTFNSEEAFQGMAPVQEQVNPLTQQNEAISMVGTNKVLSFLSKNKKIFTIAGIAVSALAILGLGGYFGFKFFVRSSDLKILNATAKNTIAAKNMSIDFRTGVSGISVQGSIQVDKDQNLKLKLDNDLLPIEALYIKKDDRGFVKLDDSGSRGIGGLIEEDNVDKKVDEVEYIQFDNVQKAIEKYGLSEMGMDSLNPNKNYLTKENLEFIKKVGDEKVDGKNLYKYNFTPDEAFRKKTVDKINESAKKLGTEDLSKITDADTKMDIWISKKDLKLYKIKGETKYEYVYFENDYTGCSSSSEAYFDCIDKPNKKEKKEKISLEWELEFKYENQGDISLPKNAKITETIDLANFKEEAEKKANDTKKKADFHEIQNALEQYFVDNDHYPSQDTWETDLVGTYLKDKPSDMSKESGNKKYTYKSDGSPATNYTLEVQLQNQGDSGSNVVTKNGVKIYRLSSKQ